MVLIASIALAVSDSIFAVEGPPAVAATESLAALASAEDVPPLSSKTPKEPLDGPEFQTADADPDAPLDPSTGRIQNAMPE